MLAVGVSADAVHLAPGDTIEESFAIGTEAAATLPAGWRVDSVGTVRTVGTFADAGDATEKRGGDSLPSNAACGIYNFGAGAASTADDRAVGFLSSGSGVKSGNLYVHLRNHDANSITGFTLAYQVEKYRNGSNPAGFSVQLHHSTNGVAWTSAGTDFTTFFPPDPDNNGFDPAPGVTNDVNRALPVAVPSRGEFYLAWSYSVASNAATTSAQALGLDDVRITALGEPGGAINLPPVLTVTPERRTVFSHREVVATASATDPDEDTVTISVSSTNIPGVANCFNPVSGVFAWTPTDPGDYSVTFTADDGRGGTASRDLILQVLGDRLPVRGGFVWRFDSTDANTVTGTVGVSASPIARKNSAQVEFLSTESASSGYAGASGGGNGASAVDSDPFDPDSSTYLEFALEPDLWVEISLSGIGFGSRSTSSGPQALALRCSLDGFATPLATLTAAPDSQWTYHSNRVSAVFRTATSFRLYATDPVSASTSANWRVDDLSVTFTARSLRPSTMLLIR